MTSRATLSLISILVLGACASSSTPPPGGDPFGEPGEGSIRIIVQNLNFSDARLYVLRRGARSTLGIVGGKTDAEFSLDWDISDPVQIEIDMLAGPSCTTRAIQADPGDIIELQIASVFRNSQACR